MLEEILRYLKDNASEKYKSNVVRMGIPAEEAIGVSTSELRKLAKKYPKDKQLVDQLWRAGFHETKIIGVLLMKPNEYTSEEIEDYMSFVISWDLCDLFCKTVLIKRKDFEAFILKWLKNSDTYRKRASYTLIASMSVHSAVSDEEVEKYLQLIDDSTIPNDPIIRKAVSWALRELGKIDEPAKAASIELATKFSQSEDKARQWIGKDALKELETLVRVSGRNRLISSKSKMGKEATQ